MKRHIDIGNLGDALSRAKEYQRRFREPVRYQEQQLTEALESEFQGESKRVTDLVENFVVNLVALLHPQMINGDQTLVCRGPEGGLSSEAAAGLPFVIRKCWEVSGWDMEIEQVVTDMILGWAVVETLVEDSRIERKAGTVIPVARHIHPDDFFLMPGPRRWEHCGAYFVRRVVSRKALLTMADANPEQGWRTNIINSLEVAAHGDDDDEVVYYEGWARPSSWDHKDIASPPKHRDEYDGVSFWIDEDGEHLRPMQHFFGIEGGPYVLFGASRSTTSPYPQGIAVTSANNADGVEAMIANIEDRVMAMQTLILTNQSERDLKEHIERGRGGVIGMGANFDKDSIHEVTIEGPRREQLEWLQQRKDFLYQVAGITQMDLGKTGSRVSATEASMVHNKSNNRMDGLLNNLYRSLRMVARRMCFYAVVDEDVVVPLGPDASEATGYFSPVWEGGLPDGVTFESLGLEISVAYGHRMNPELLAMRYLQGLDIAARAANLKTMFPDSNIDGLLRKIFDVMEVPELRKLILGDPAPDPKLLQAQQSPVPGGMLDPRQVPQMAQASPVGILQ